jgi:aldose 1-epimerase
MIDLPSIALPAVWRVVRVLLHGLTMSSAVELQHDGWMVEVLTRGGGMASCRFHEQDLLQATPQGPFATGPASDLCYYPLVPFCNRILNGRFVFEGRTIRLAPNLLGHPHVLHGHGWQAEWQVIAADRASCELRFEHLPVEGWPWSYRATQKFTVAADSLTIELALRNLSTNAMPAGLGFHPFFPNAESAVLHASAHRISQEKAELFPMTTTAIPAALDFGRARPVRDARGLDHNYSGWNGSATIEWADAPQRIELAAASLANLHVYIPEARDFFCVEPVSHALHAFNFAESEERTALILPAGAQLAAALVLRCEIH